MEASQIVAVSPHAATAAAPAAPRIGLRPHPALPWLMLPEGVPLQVLIDVAPVRIPNTRPWFHGVVSQRGNLLPVFDIGHWAGFDALDRASAQIAAVGLGAHACAVLCAATPMVLTAGAVGVGTRHEGTALSPYLGEGCRSAVGTAHLFDFERWLATAARQVSASGASAAH